MSRQDDNPNNQYQSYFRINSYHLDKIEDILNIQTQDEMDFKINKNIINLNKIFQNFKKKTKFENNLYSNEEIDNFIYALKFVDTLNLFMQNQTLTHLLNDMNEIAENVQNLSNFEYKDTILKKIKYTEMTVIYLKKRTFQNLYFGDRRSLAEMIEANLQLVTKGGKFEQKTFKQMQNLFYVVQGRIDEPKRTELQNKLQDMKSLSIKYKKQRQNQGNYFEDSYNDYSDYKNYSNTGNNLYDYNQNFYDNEHYYEEDYNTNYYNDSRRFHTRHPYRNNTYNSSYYNKKYFESEEKEYEVNSSEKNYFNDNNNENYDDKKNNSIEVIQSVVSNQGKGYYNNDYRHRNSGNINSQIIQQNINNYNYKKKKKIPKQRGGTLLVEVPIPNSVIQNEELNKENIQKETKEETNINNNTSNNNSSGPSLTNIPQIIRKPKENNDNKNKETKFEYKDDSSTNNSINTNNSDKYLNKYYHNPNSSYKQNPYNKGMHYNYHQHRENHYHNNYYTNQNNIQSGNNSDNGYYNRRNKQYFQNSGKPKRDFVEIDSLPKNKYSAEAKEVSYPIQNPSIAVEVPNVQDEKKIENKETQNQTEEKQEQNKEEIKDNNNIEKENGNMNDSNQEKKNENNTTNIEIIKENNQKITIEKNINNESMTEPNKEQIIENNNQNPIEINENNLSENKNINIEKKISNEEIIEKEILKPRPIELMNFNRNFLTPSPEPTNNPEIIISDENLPMKNYHGIINENEEDEIENEESSDSMPNEEEINQQFNQFISESLGTNEREQYYLNNNKTESEDDDDLVNDINVKDIEYEIEEEIIKNVIENEQELEQESYEEKIEEFIKDKIDLDTIIHQAQKEIVDEEEQKKLFEEQNKDVKNLSENKGNIYTNAAKEVDATLLGVIKNKLSEDFTALKNKKVIIPSFVNYSNGFPGGNTSIFDQDFINKVIFYKQNLNIKMTLTNYMMNNLQFFIRGRDALLKREYLQLKIEEIENPANIWNNLVNFENKILIPLYQRINYNVNKKRDLYSYLFQKYKKIIQKSLIKEKVIRKIKPYGSYMNNFLIDSGDIDICIVPRCNILEFDQYFEKIKEEIINKKYAEHKLTHRTGRYVLLRVIDNKTKFMIDICVHNMLPILNTNLIRLYSLFDQRFHILGLYIKHWAKINKIHGAPDKFLSSYALLLLLIHFLQKVVEPRVLPNLQKIDINKENLYKYYHNGEYIKTNIYYEEDLNKIKGYMNKINKGLENKESAVNLLVKFFEYYSYFFDNDQIISINRDLNECIKNKSDNIAFSIEDPFDKQHNPGKSMQINSIPYSRFITAMKREINFILNGEYIKRLDKILNNGNILNGNN